MKPTPGASSTLTLHRSRRGPLLVVTALLLVIGCASSRTPRIEVQPDFARHFREAGVTGTFVLYDAGEQRILVHDPDRAQTRAIPASTFKIPHALIALETGVVADTHAVFAWDGVERDIAPWNRDHTFATAFEYSVVWAFQRVARRVGEARMRAHLRRLGYGNADIGGGIDRFWLDGDLRISPMEQVNFLRRLHERRLPVSDRAMRLVEGIMVEERRPHVVLHAKTGWAVGEAVDVGWYVGYVVRGDRTHYFALGMDIARTEQGPARRAIARAILTEQGLL